MKSFSEFLAEMLDLTADQKEVAVSNKMHALVHMHPRKFLELTTHDDEHVAEIKRAAQPVHAYNSHSASGSIRVAPFLRIDHRGKVMSHEGRHRAAALLNAGHDVMPVYLRHHGDPASDKPDREHGFGDFPEKITGQVRGSASKSHDMKLLKNRVGKIR